MECAIDGCGVRTADYCNVDYQIPVCQGHAAKMASENVYLKIVMVEPALNKIAADQRDPGAE